MTEIVLKNISKTFHDRRSKEFDVKAIDDLSLKVKSGEAVVLLGPSGCGKTTLLRIIAGLDSPDEGEVYHNGVLLDDIPIESRGIGMVFQNYVLIPHWESRKTIGFFLSLRKREDEVPAHVDMVAKITGVAIQHLMGKFPRHLSGGEKQRVSIARAFARDLQLLLFDEPFANLDAKFRGEARVELKRLINQFDVTLVYVTHDQVEAMSVADRIVILNAGKIVQMGNYFDLHDDPNNLFVAEFIGTPTINTFHGVARNGKWEGTAIGQYPLPSHVPDGKEVLLAVRPAHFRLVGEGQGIPAKIERVTPYFAEKFNLLDVYKGDCTWQVQVPLEIEFEAGSTIHCAIDIEEIFFFEAKNGARIA